MVNPLPLSPKKPLDALRDNLSSIAPNPAAKYEGVILKVLPDTLIPAGQVEHIMARGLDTEKNSYTQVRVRVEALHSALKKEDVNQHPVAIALSSDYIVEGNSVQISFEDAYTGKGGFILNSFGGAVSGSVDSGDDGYPSDPTGGGRFPAGTAGLRGRTPPNPDQGLPFEVQVIGKLNRLRDVLMKELDVIAKAAGWYYGATKSVTYNVTSGFRPNKTQEQKDKIDAQGREKMRKCTSAGGTAADCESKRQAYVKNAKKKSLNHSTGNATDFNILIDGSSLGKGESYAFLAALASNGRIPPGGIGLYSANDKDSRLIFKPDRAHPHYDIRKKPFQWHWYKPKGNAKSGQGHSASPKAAFIEGNSNIYKSLAKNLKKRIKKIYGELDKSIKWNEKFWATLQDQEPDLTKAKATYKSSANRNSPKKSDRLKTLTGKAHADAAKAAKARIKAAAFTAANNAKMLAASRATANKARLAKNEADRQARIAAQASAKWGL